MPPAIAEIAGQNPAVVYALLFRAAAKTLRTIAADPTHLGAEIGFFAVLHTWGQALVHHPHLHCVVPGGGLSPDGTRWIACRPGFFLPVRVLSSRACFAGCCSRRFRTRSTRGNSASPGPSRPWADRQAFAGHLTPARQTDWVVYAKPPFAGPAQVLDYVGRYTHRIAISNHRVLDMEDGHVRFRHKNYRAKAPTPHATMTLTAREFIRRFLLHVLPPGFHRIRYYGFLGNRHRTEKLARCRRLLDTDATPPAPTEGPREPTIATATRPSPAAPYAAVPSVTAGT